METKANASQSFKIEDLLKGKISRDQFQIDYLPMYKMLDELDRKLANQGGLSSLASEEIWKRIYDFGIIGVSLDKADMETRIDQLNEQNLKWYTKADTLELELNSLRAEYERIKLSTQANEEAKVN